MDVVVRILKHLLNRLALDAWATDRIESIGPHRRNVKIMGPARCITHHRGMCRVAKPQCWPNALSVSPRTSSKTTGTREKGKHGPQKNWKEDANAKRTFGGPLVHNVGGADHGDRPGVFAKRLDFCRREEVDWLAEGLQGVGHAGGDRGDVVRRLLAVDPLR